MIAEGGKVATVVGREWSKKFNILWHAARSAPRPRQPVHPLWYVTLVVSRRPELDEEEAVRGKENVTWLGPIPSIICSATVVTHHKSFIIPTIIPPIPLMSTPKSSSSFGGYDNIFTRPPFLPTAYHNRIRPSASTIIQQSFKVSEMSVDSNLPAEQVSSSLIESTLVAAGSCSIIIFTVLLYTIYIVSIYYL